MTTTKEKGNRLELAVAEALAKCGKNGIRMNVTMRDPNGNRSEIDVIYGTIFKKYVECKNYTERVELENVSKFAEVLRQNNIPLRKGIFVSENGDYAPRCKQTDIRLYSLKQFERGLKMENRIKNFAKTIIIAAVAAYGAEKINESYAQNKQETIKEFVLEKKHEMEHHLTEKYHNINHKINNIENEIDEIIENTQEKYKHTKSTITHEIKQIKKKYNNISEIINYIKGE